MQTWVQGSQTTNPPAPVDVYGVGAVSISSDSKVDRVVVDGVTLTVGQLYPVKPFTKSLNVEHSRTLHLPTITPWEFRLDLWSVEDCARGLVRPALVRASACAYARDSGALSAAYTSRFSMGAAGRRYLRLHVYNHTGGTSVGFYVVGYRYQPVSATAPTYIRTSHAIVSSAIAPGLDIGGNPIGQSLNALDANSSITEHLIAADEIEVLSNRGGGAVVEVEFYAELW